MVKKNSKRTKGLNYLVLFFTMSYMIVLTQTIEVRAQDLSTSVWIVDNKIWEFKSGELITSQAPKTFNYPCTIGDSQGNLLYLWKDDKIYNKNYEVLPNGDSITTHTRPIFIKMLINKYFLVTPSNYSIIESNEENPNGFVTKKNVTWNSMAFDNFQAVHHSNCKDIWLISHNSTELIANRLSEEGVAQTPVITAKTDTLNNSEPNCLSLNTEGNRYVATNRVRRKNYENDIIVLEFGKFDRITGSFINFDIYTFENYIEAETCSFSPDGTQLYLRAIKATPIIDLIQIPIKNNHLQPDNSLIISSFTFSGPLSNQMQVAYDGKIYDYFHFRKKINVINKPDEGGANCKFVEDLYLPELINGTFPKFVTTLFSKDYCKLEVDFSFITTCNSYLVKFSNNASGNINTINWNFGDGTSSTEAAPIHNYKDAGAYNVTLTVTDTDNKSETIKKEIEVYEQPALPIILKH